MKFSNNKSPEDINAIRVKPITSSAETSGGKSIIDQWADKHERDLIEDDYILVSRRSIEDLKQMISKAIDEWEDNECRVREIDEGYYVKGLKSKLIGDEE